VAAQAGLGRSAGAVAVTEPTSARMSPAIVTSATPTDGGWLINGVKTCALLPPGPMCSCCWPAPTRTAPFPIAGSPCSWWKKPRGDGHGSPSRRTRTIDPGSGTGRLEGRPIDTLGYRGCTLMIVFVAEYSFRRNLVGGGSDGFGEGPIPCRCRASRTAGCRPRPGRSGSCRRPTKPPSPTPPIATVFGSPIGDYQLTGQAGPHGGHHCGHARSLPGGTADGQGRGDAGGLHAQGLCVPGGRVGRARGHADTRRDGGTRRSSR